ncbi:MAG TPA: hypothetical protein VEY70_05525 [Metabacillus sp.]|nr:hypothetical protein [Metabacillus sp.]
METNVQTTQNINIVTKKEMNIRRLLNGIGVFIFAGLFLSIVTIPISINGQLEFFINEELKMDGKHLKEFSIFTTLSAIIYFILVNIYFIGRTWRKVFFTALFLILCFSLFMVIYLINYPTAKLGN